MAMNCSLTVVAAQELFDILDDVIGVFRFDNMKEKHEKYWQLSKERFIETYCHEIPELFWFQGGIFNSCELVFDSNGFRVVAQCGNAEMTSKIDEVNARIAAANVHPTVFQEAV